MDPEKTNARIIQSIRSCLLAKYQQHLPKEVEEIVAHHITLAWGVGYNAGLEGRRFFQFQADEHTSKRIRSSHNKKTESKSS